MEYKSPLRQTAADFLHVFTHSSLAATSQFVELVVEAAKEEMRMELEPKPLKVNPSVMSEQDGNQLIQAIRAFQEGIEPPAGRFKIKGDLREQIVFVKDGCSTRVDEIIIKGRK